MRIELRRLPLILVLVLAATVASALDVKDPAYGARGDGVTDDTVAIQAAINAAQASAGDGYVYFPSTPGTYYKVTAPLTVSDTGRPLRIVGANWQTTEIRATAAMVAVFNLPNAQCDSFEWRDLKVNANSLANYAILAPRLSHSLMSRIYATGGLLAGVSFSFGWDNEIVHSQIRDNAGDGFLYSLKLVAGVNGNNALRIRDTKIFGNDGVGVRLWYPVNALIEGCTIETNAMGGIYLPYNARAVVIRGNYFEANASVGLAFTTPAVTVKADIIINGTDGSLNRFMNITPALGVVIEGNHTFGNNLTGAASAFTYLISGDGIRLADNVAWPGYATPLLRTRDDPALCSLADVVIGRNKQFSSAFVLDPGPGGLNLAGLSYQ